MKGSYINIMVAVIVLLPNITEAQSFKKDMEAMYNAYLKATDFYAKVDVKMYERTKDTKPNIRRNAIIRKSNYNFFYELDNNKMLMNNKCVVMVDGDNKTVVYKEGKRNKKSSIPDVVAPNFDSLLTDYDKVVYKGIYGKNKLYSITLKNANVKQIDLYLDQDKKWLKKIVYHYNEAIYKIDSRVVITFNGVTDKPNFSKTQFSERQFVVKQNGEMKLTTNYKSYRLIKMDAEY
jgi:hypothetical protein